MSHDPFDNFDKHFDSIFDRAEKSLAHPYRTAAVGLALYALGFVFVIAVVVCAILFLQAHGVF